MTTDTYSTPASTTSSKPSAVPVMRTVSVGPRFPRLSAHIARHFPDTLSLVSGILFLAIAIGGPIYGAHSIGDAGMLASAVGKVLSFGPP